MNDNFFLDKRILITGAGGTVGRALASYLISRVSERLYLLDHSETSLFYTVHMLNDEKAVPILGELTDPDYVKYLLDRLNVDIIYHAAAYKHVDLLEKNPIEAIKNNVFGTKFLLNACDNAYDFRKNIFIFISTDKAVEPINVYGVSKAIGEDLVLNSSKPRRYVVRFGNIYNSSGSVVRIFKHNIEHNKPIVVRKGNVRRFFITKEEAAKLMFLLSKYNFNNGVYVLGNMKTIAIKSLAENLIKKSGKKILITYEDLPKYEKEYEKLYAEDESLIPTGIENISFVQKRPNKELVDLLYLLELFCFASMRTMNYRHKKKLRSILKEYYPNLVLYPNESEY